jgi:hypothetical protein
MRPDVVRGWTVSAAFVGVDTAGVSDVGVLEVISDALRQVVNPE